VSTFAQTPDGDLALTSGKLTLLTEDADVVAVNLFNRFRLFLGEWFLDTRVGIPYIPQVLGVKNPDLRVIAQLFRRIILNTPGVIGLENVDVAFDRGVRNLSYSFLAKAKDGRTINGSSTGPFIVGDSLT